MVDLNRQPVWKEIPVNSGADVAIVRNVVGSVAECLSFSSQRKAEAVLAASELAQNHINCHTVRGRIAVSGVWCGQAGLLTLFSVDDGPGIQDVDRAVLDGVTTRGSYGNGLGTVRRLSDDFAICSGASGSAPCSFDLGSGSGSGTMVAASLWWPRKDAFPHESLRLSAIVSPLPGELFCGDGVHIKTRENFTRIVLMDVLGHGRDAALSVSRAQTLLNAMDPGDSLEEVVTCLDGALAGLRGMAALFMTADASTGRVQTCGVGNICACFRDGAALIPVTSLSGVLGQNFNCRRLMVQSFVFRRETACIMSTDGLEPSAVQEGFRNDSHPLFSCYLAFARGVSGRDDASLIVWKWLNK